MGIQIHLMLLLIKYGCEMKGVKGNSNTSHVTINRLSITHHTHIISNSNTSHVTINRKERAERHNP